MPSLLAPWCRGGSAAAAFVLLALFASLRMTVHNGTIAVASISTFARGSSSALTTTTDIAG